MPFLLFGALCVEEDDTARADIISTIFFVSGMVTISQTVIGVRLPIVQGSSFGIFNIVLAILSLPEYQCPANFGDEGWGNITQAEKTEEWQMRMRVVQGSLALASIVQVTLGYFGVHGQSSGPNNTLCKVYFCYRVDRAAPSLHNPIDHCTHACLHWTIPPRFCIRSCRSELVCLHKVSTMYRGARLIVHWLIDQFWLIDWIFTKPIGVSNNEYIWLIDQFWFIDQFFLPKPRIH